MQKLNYGGFGPIVVTWEIVGIIKLGFELKVQLHMCVVSIEVVFKTLFN